MEFIENIKNLIKEKKFNITKHFLIRSIERNIDIDDIINNIENIEIIENYTNSFPYPSALCYLQLKDNKILHIVIGSNNDEVWFITVYEPNDIEWDITRKIRRI